jgi:hypothetical protein
MDDADGFNREHGLETYRSLISISVEGLKALILLNGGAVVALLAYLGQIQNQPALVSKAATPMKFFLGALVATALCFGGSYLTQLSLYQESVHGKKPTHHRWLWATFFFAIVSIAAFAFGAMASVRALSHAD